jgi:YVTN family beta-propeller protein
MFSALCVGVIVIVIVITSLSGTGEILGDSVISSIPVGVFPQALIFNPSNNNIYVANRDSETVSVIDSTSNTLIKNVTVGMSPQALIFNPSNNNIYVANHDSETVSVIDSTNNTPIKNIKSAVFRNNYFITLPITTST